MASDLFGLLAEFDNADALVQAARRTHEAGYRVFDAYTPFPVEGLAEAIGFRESRLGLITGAAFAAGGAGGFLVQWWINVVDYPINVGGRALAAWPAFVLPAFELAVLTAAIVAFVTLLWSNRLPKLYHPLFNAQRFANITQDRFALCIEATDPAFDAEETRRFLEGLDPTSVEEVTP